MNVRNFSPTLEAALMNLARTYAYKNEKSQTLNGSLIKLKGMWI